VINYHLDRDHCFILGDSGKLISLFVLLQVLEIDYLVK